jgi:sarcosine oxidase
MSEVAARYAHVVLGCGAIGSAAAYWLSRRSAGSVLVLEQYALGHDRGASEDHSRIIRHAYHTTDYTALTDDAYAAWRHVEGRTGLPLVLTTGGLDIGVGSAGELEIASYAAALAATGHASEPLDAAQLTARFPQWHVDDDVVALYQAESGILDIRKANAAHVALARSGGATIRDRTPVARLETFPDRVELTVPGGVVVAGHLTLCAGSWTSPLLEGIGVRMPIALTHEQVTYWSTAHLLDFAPDRFPIWIYHGPDRSYYGFPVYGEAAVKAGRDFSERFVSQETRTSEPDAAQRDDLTRFMDAHLPGALGPELYTKTCVYDLPPDRNFVLDLVPGEPRVSVFVGAGHAAKFASLVGKILAEIAVDGGTRYPIDAFSARRPAIVDPDYPTDFRFSNAARTARSAG